MALPEALKGAKWSRRIACKILPLLVSYAESCRTITYEGVDKEVIKRGWSPHKMFIAYRYPAGAIGYALMETEKEWGIKIPPINALIVSKNTSFPGKGVDYFLKNYVRRDRRPAILTTAQRASIIEEIHKDIFTFDKWTEILEEYGLPRLPPPKAKGSKTIKSKKYKWSHEGESREHKKLKNYISQNPNAVGLPDSCAPGDTEYLLPSADKIDVLFNEDGHLVAIEVKASNANDEDLLRGVFQCIKYRELLKAEQRASRIIPHATSYLVTERKLPKKAKKIAERLNVKAFTIKLTSKSRELIKKRD